MPRTFLRILMDVQSELGIQRDQAMGVMHLNNAFRFMWDHFEWRETLGDLPPFYLTPNHHIYRSPFIAIPTDFVDLFSAEVVTVNVEGIHSIEALHVIRNLEDDNSLRNAFTPAMGYSNKHGAFLVTNLAPAVIGYVYIQAKYKKDYPYDLSTVSNASNPFSLPRHEGPFVQVLKWFIRGQRQDEAQQVAMVLSMARQSEHPGRQDFHHSPKTPTFGHMGMN